MYLSAVTVCVDYSDFLSETIPFNKPQFDYWVVVTTPDDIATQKLCESWGVHVVTTDAMTDGDGFNKAAGINIGLEVLKANCWGGWYVHIDADIALPPHSRGLLNQLHLDPTMIYGIDRHNVLGSKEWHKHLRKPTVQHEHNAYLHAEAFPVATRFVSTAFDGYVPIGFFQLWNPAASGIFRYPIAGHSADRSDTMMAVQWPRSKRGFLPEIIGYHLESEVAPQGANWNGRQTRPFDSRGWWCRKWHWFWWERRQKRHHNHHHYHQDLC